MEKVKDPNKEKVAGAKHNISLSSNEENSPKKRKPSAVFRKAGKVPHSKETPIKRFLRKKEAKLPSW